MAEYSAYHGLSEPIAYHVNNLLMPRSALKAMRNPEALVPSTPQEWNVHRELITRLYRDQELPLKEVQRIMQTDYHFKATKRMFNTRLKQWNICKNYRAEEKEVLAAQIARAHLESRSASDLTFKDRPVKLDRVLRHLRAKRRGMTATKKAAKGRRRSANDEGSSSDSSTSVMTQDSGPRVHSNSRYGSRTITPESGTTTSAVLTPPSEPEQPDEPYESVNRESIILVTANPGSPLFPPKGTLNVEVILSQTQAYYLHTVWTNKDGLAGAQDSIAKTFWTNVKTGIYFLKKQSPTLAWPLLNEACAVASDVFSHAPILFLTQVFTVLSPVNTTVCPLIRSTLMKYLAGMASIKLKSAQHPLAVILKELSLDNEYGEASEKALNMTLSLLTQNLGTGHSATFAVHRSLITLLRRDRRLALAKQHGEELVETTQCVAFSRSNLDIETGTASLSMTVLCIALTELIHIHMDLGQYALARNLCSTILQNYQLSQGVTYPDDRAAYALEDMAEICSRMGDYEAAADWLRQALDASGIIRGRQNATTEHIRAKLQHVTTTLALRTLETQRLAFGSQAADY
ncbi:hypothetical protein H2200_002764 [Cladophialophora chaetospira]|uniref:Clr5 domain-containing protein n=1 Tax=Cladophialophora chaetospira TaxID=386627 RepID=A0AA38XJH5_9EURO|nr:hypothetical protein H2200_002764 [Cladophialophora chaetospira]